MIPGVYYRKRSKQIQPELTAHHMGFLASSRSWEREREAGHRVRHMRLAGF